MTDTTGTRAIKLVGECFLPGASLALDGNLKDGALHLAGGIVGRMVFGPLGWIYAAANSYSNSVTGKHFHEHFLADESHAEQPAA